MLFFESLFNFDRRLICLQADYSESYGWIVVKFLEVLSLDTRNSQWSFGHWGWWSISGCRTFQVLLHCRGPSVEISLLWGMYCGVESRYCKSQYWITANTTCMMSLGMHVEIFHFEIFKNFMEILKYFKTPSLKYFMKFLIFIIKWLKTFKNIIKVYEVSRKRVMLFCKRQLHLCIFHN